MRGLLVLTLLLLTALPAAAQRTGEPPASLDAVVREHIRAIRARDLSRLERTVTGDDELQLIFGDGRRSTTRAEYLAFYREQFARTGWSLTIRPVSQVERGELATVTARTRQEEREGRRVAAWTEAWLTLTFAREGGAWRLVHDQTTRIRSGP